MSRFRAGVESGSRVKGLVSLGYVETESWDCVRV